MSAIGTSDDSLRPGGKGGERAVVGHPMPLEDGTFGKAILVQVRGNRRVVYLTVTTAFANALFTALNMPACILSDLLNEATYLSPIGSVSKILLAQRNRGGARGNKLTDHGPAEKVDEPETDPADDVPIPARLTGNNGTTGGAVDEKTITGGRETKALDGTDKSENRQRKRTPAEEKRWHLHVYKKLMVHQEAQLKETTQEEYHCPNAALDQNCSFSVSPVRGKNCSYCRAEMTVELEPDTGLAMVEDAPSVTFMEDLQYIPLTDERTFAELVMKGKDILDMSTVTTRAVTVGIKQVLQLAHAAFTSSTPVTDVFGCVGQTLEPY